VLEVFRFYPNFAVFATTLFKYLSSRFYIQFICFPLLAEWRYEVFDDNTCGTEIMSSINHDLLQLVQIYSGRNCSSHWDITGVLGFSAAFFSGEFSTAQ
jgi:hypothetical protein